MSTAEKGLPIYKVRVINILHGTFPLTRSDAALIERSVFPWSSINLFRPLCTLHRRNKEEKHSAYT